MFSVLVWALVSLQQGPPTSDTLRLPDLYKIAAQQNPRIAGATALANAARARVTSARRPPDPQFQFGVMNYAVPEWRPMEALGMVQVQAMQMLPLVGKLGIAGRMAESGASAEAERARDVAWDVRTKVAMAFYDLYATDQSLATDRQTLRLLDDALRVAEAMYRVGEGRQADVLRAQVEITRMTQDTARMASMRTAIAARLAARVGRDAVTGAPALPRFADSIPSTSSLTMTAFDDRPMLRAAARDVDAASSRTKLAARELWPDLTVGVQYGRRGGMQGTEHMASVMLGATLPVFARSRQLQMREEARAMEQMAHAELEAVRAETNAGVIEARADLVRARTLASSYRTTLIPQAEASVESALASYRVGRVDFMTLLDARMNVNRFRKELATLEAEEGKAWAELEMLTGREMLGRGTGASVADARREP
jgi:outer membrane protein TolC